MGSDTEVHLTDPSTTDQLHEPVVAAVGDSVDLYGISTWEVRSWFDRLCMDLYTWLYLHRRLLFVLFGGLFLLGQSAIVIVVMFIQPLLALFTFLSIVPALVVISYLWFRDADGREPVTSLIITFGLGAVLSGGLALVFNTAFTFGGFLTLLVPVLVAPPVEEVAKLAAIRVYAYKSKHFNSVLDGVVYGAIAGLGFATIENASYILNFASDVGAANITVTRAMTAPGHVIWTAISGYYLGLAKYNQENAGPIVLKGLLIAIFFHGVHNLVGPILGPVFTIPWLVVALVVLYRLVQRYRIAYKEAYSEEPILFDWHSDGRETSVMDMEKPTLSVDRSNPYDQLKNLQELHELGILSDEEFEEKRQRALDLI